MRPHQIIIQKEINILDEIVEALLNPRKVGVDKDELFRLLNHYTVSTATPSGSNEHKKQVVSKLVEFDKVLDLGYKLCDNMNFLTISEFVNMLSTNVYINHLPTNLKADKTEKFIDSLYYMPDLRLVWKNVFVLVINYLRKIDPAIAQSEDYEESYNELKNFLLLFNISIINKLIKIFKCLNPELKLKAEVLMVTLMSS
ncbi:unnamed protein product [Ambrosiozyma monospora]|uniref:Unnamed protein product n=1 Tax=Ambrosiozyma monospora TaxID=43982 RepID=A0ACB5T8K9_AMBMO|nr:unnamed protein product [Ambrosiozyma monospora]